MASAYSTYDTETGEFIQVYNLEDCLRSIRVRNQDNENRIKYLEEKNKELKENNYKDNEIQKMKTQLDKMQKDYWRGFPISEGEEKSIEEWKEKHDKEVHGYTKEIRMKAEGVSGGRYSYRFCSTALGTSGVIKCSCGAEFEFKEIG